MALASVVVRVLRAHDLVAADSNGASDPYVVVQCSSGDKGKTSVKTPQPEAEPGPYAYA